MRRIYSRVLRDGVDNCFLNDEQLYSERAMKLILTGERVMFENLSSFKGLMANRVKQQKDCGFYSAKSSLKQVGGSMLFSKNLDKTLKNKIDSM